MKILIDLQALQSPSARRGIGRYSASLVDALLRAPRSHELIFSVNARLPTGPSDVANDRRSLDARARVHVFGTPPLDWSPTDEQLDVARVVQSAHWESLAPDIVHVNGQFEPEGWQSVTPDAGLRVSMPRTATLYDLIPLLYPDRYLADETPRRYYERKLAGLRAFDGLLAISQSARDDAIRLLPATPEQVHVVRGAADALFRPVTPAEPERIRLRWRYGLSRAFVMYTSGPDFRKNNEALVRAWAALPRPMRTTHQLVIVMALDHAGLESGLRAAAAAAGLGPDDLVLPGFVPDEDLVQLYSMCSLFVFPSLYEGFGLPVLEAMQCGAPVIAGANSSLPELVGRADALFDASSDAAITARIAQALSDPGMRADLAAHGLQRAAEFTWADCARRTFDAWEAMHEQRRAARMVRVAPSLPQASRTLAIALAAAPDEQAAAQLCLMASASDADALPRLLIDCTWLSANDAHSGIQRVVRRLATSLPGTLPGRFSQLRLVRLERGFLWSSMLEQTLLHRPAAASEPVPLRDNDTLLMLDSSWDVYPQFAATFARVRSRGGRIATVLYDTIPLHVPELCNPAVPPVFERWLETAVLHSDALLCISRAVLDDARDIIERRGWLHGALQLGHFVLGADVASPSGAPVPLPFTPHGKLFTTVSTIEPRKGHATLLAAFEAFWIAGGEATLCLVGREGWNVQPLAAKLRNHPERGRRLVWLDDADDATLLAVYRASDVLAFPSLAEGFGLGIVEAARFGVPILCSDLPVFREVAGNGARYVPLNDAAAWTAAIRQVAAGVPLPDPAAVRSVDWTTAAEELLACLVDGRSVTTLPSSLTREEVAETRMLGVLTEQTSLFRWVEAPERAAAMLARLRP